MMDLCGLTVRRGGRASGWLILALHAAVVPAIGWHQSFVHGRLPTSASLRVVSGGELRCSTASQADSTRPAPSENPNK